MRKKHKGSILLIILTIMVLPASGCTFLNTGTTSTQGVVIDNFEVDFPRIYSSERFKIQMRIVNEGYVDANNVYPKLYNIGASFQDDRMEISCEETCGGVVSLLAQDPDRGTIGESTTCIWNCIAPEDIPKGLSLTFSPSVRLYYLYKTHTVKSITIASQDELRSLQSQGKSPPSETVSTTEGPVQLDVVVKGPIRYWEGEERIVFPININIQNTGGGTACTDQKEFSIPVGVPTPPLYIPPTQFIDVIVGGCDRPDYWNNVILYFHREGDLTRLYCGNDEIDQKVVELWKGQSATLTCEVDMPVPSSHVGIIQKNLKFSIYYAYFTDRTTNVEVVGR